MPFVTDRRKPLQKLYEKLHEPRGKSGGGGFKGAGGSTAAMKGAGGSTKMDAKDMSPRARAHRGEITGADAMYLERKSGGGHIRGAGLGSSAKAATPKLGLGGRSGVGSAKAAPKAPKVTNPVAKAAKSAYKPKGPAAYNKDVGDFYLSAAGGYGSDWFKRKKK